jgi:hypothetical protein
VAYSIIRPLTIYVIILTINNIYANILVIIQGGGHFFMNIVFLQFDSTAYIYTK